MLDFSCLKCGSLEYDIRNVYLPEKASKLVGFELGLYYFKICKCCGYTEIYDAKICDNNEKLCIFIKAASI